MLVPLRGALNRLSVFRRKTGRCRGRPRSWKAWARKEFADKVGLSGPRQLQNWLSDKHLPAEIESIEDKLFGRDQKYARQVRLELREAHQRQRTKLGAATNIPICVPTHFMGREDAQQLSHVSEVRERPQANAKLIYPPRPASFETQRPRIVVECFEDVSRDPRDSALTHHIHQCINRELRRRNKLFVIGNGGDGDYVVKGSVWKDGCGAVQICADLIAVKAGEYLWHYPPVSLPPVSLQRPLQLVTADVAIGTLDVIRNEETKLAHARLKSRKSLASWESYLLGNWFFGRMTPKDAEEAGKFFKLSYGLHPGLGISRSRLALTYLVRIGYGTLLLGDAVDRATTLCRLAIADNLDDAADAEAVLALSTLMGGDHGHSDHDTAERLLSSAFQKAPDSSLVNSIYALHLVFTERVSAGQFLQKRAERLDENDPPAAYCTGQIPIGDYLRGRYFEALQHFSETARKFPEYLPSIGWKAATLAQLGQVVEARDWVCTAENLSPGGWAALFNRQGRPPVVPTCRLRAPAARFAQGREVSGLRALTSIAHGQPKGGEFTDRAPRYVSGVRTVNTRP